MVSRAKPRKEFISLSEMVCQQQVLNNISKGKTVFLGGAVYIYIYIIVVIKLFNHSCPETGMQRRNWLLQKSSGGSNF